MRREIPSERPATSPVSQEEWDRLVSLGVRPATHPARDHQPLPQRPRWLAFLIRLTDPVVKRIPILKRWEEDE